MIGNIGIAAVVQNVADCQNGNTTRNCTALIDGEALYFNRKAVGEPAAATTLSVSNPAQTAVVQVNGQVGDILFFDRANSTLVTRLSGSSATAANVARVIEEIFTSELDANGEYQASDGSIIPGIFPGSGFGFGFGLFNLPNLFWILAAAYGVKRLTSDD